MKRLLWLTVANLAVLGAAWAQDAVSVRVAAPPCGRFYVDGQQYQTAATFFWAPHTWHTLKTGETYQIADEVRCRPGGGWRDDSGETSLNGNTVNIYVTKPASYSTSASLVYRLSVILSHGTGSLAFDCNGTSFVTVNGTCLDEDTRLWVPAGTTVTATAHPPAGFVFLGWGSPGLDAGTTAVFTMLGPKALDPQWRPAGRYTVKSDPPGMKVLVDHAPVLTPITLDWSGKSTHALSPLSPQEVTPGGEKLAFVSWSDGGPEDRVISAPASGRSNEVTIKYGKTSACTFGTRPAGLSLTIDGRSNWPNYRFVWGLGSKHTISAPLEQVDAQGRQWAFKRWTMGGAAEQEYTVVAGTHPAQNAIYEVQGQLLIDSATPNAHVLVDGKPCATPCAVNRAAGTQVAIAAPQVLANGDYERLEFKGWSDGGPAERVWTATDKDQRLTANFDTTYRIVMRSDPAGGCNFRFSPASTEGFFPINSEITVTAEPKPGFTFRTWDGQTQLSPTLKVRVYAPQAFTAVLNTYPHLEGVFNAAGETPEAYVAPGSIVAIRGANLAPETANGPVNPLAQSIAGVSAQVNNHLLPLFSISPEELSAQLPSTLADGEYTLVVQQPRRENVDVQFKVRRNAPGLFTDGKGEESLALALHARGDQVTLENPATRGETITLLGTGFGPYQPPVADGAAVSVDPKAPQYKLADTVEIRMGEKTVLRPVSAQAAKGFIGMIAVEVKIPANAPDGPLELRAAVKDPADQTGKTYRESNTVRVPLKK